MSRLKRLLQEVHQRSLWQLMASYIVGAWLVLQIAETLASLIGLPLWFGAGVIAVLAFGLVLVLTTGLVQVISAYPLHPDRSYRVLRWLFSWRNVLITALVALAVLVFGTGGYLGLRAMGVGPMGSLVAKGVIEPGERIVLADFDDNADDSLLALAATVSFRTDLSQSRTLRLAESDYIDRVLSRMAREPGTPIDHELAREIAVREGLRAVIAGEVVGRASSGYVFSARLVSAESGEVVVAYRENARGSSDVIPAIDRLSRRLRERAGESLRAIRSNPPLEQVTTTSLEALKKYSQAIRRPYDQVPLLLEAVAIDTSFAMAHGKLAATYRNAGERRLAVESAKRAYEHRDRLTELERYITIGTYHYNVTGDQNARLQALRRAVDLSDSTDAVAMLGLAGVYGWLGDGERAETLNRWVIDLGAVDYVPYYNLFDRQLLNDQLDAAELTLQEWERAMPGCVTYGMRASLDYLRGDIPEAEQQIRAARRCREAEGNSTGAAILEAEALAWLRVVQGRLADAEALASSALASREQQQDITWARSTVLFLGLIDIVYRRLNERGVQRLERFLDEYPNDSLAPLDRPYLNLAVYYAVADRTDRARAFLDEYESTVDEEVRGVDGRFHYRNAKGIVALADGRPRDAIRELMLALNGDLPHQTLPWLARAYDLAGVPDSALVFYERYVSTPNLARRRFAMNSRWNTLGDPLWLPSIYERLGDLYEQQGDIAKAAYYYGKLIELWKDADPELQPRVEAARQAIEALSPDR